MKNAINNQVGMLGDMFLSGLVFMACNKLEARGHLLHKTGTPPKHFSQQCTILGNINIQMEKKDQKWS